MNVISGCRCPEKFKTKAGNWGAKNCNSLRNKQPVSVFWLLFLIWSIRRIKEPPKCSRKWGVRAHNSISILSSFYTYVPRALAFLPWFWDINSDTLIPPSSSSGLVFSCLSLLTREPPHKGVRAKHNESGKVFSEGPALAHLSFLVNHFLSVNLPQHRPTQVRAKLPQEEGRPALTNSVKGPRCSGAVEIWAEPSQSVDISANKGRQPQELEPQIKRWDRPSIPHRHCLHLQLSDMTDHTHEYMGSYEWTCSPQEKVFLLKFILFIWGERL